MSSPIYSYVNDEGKTRIINLDAITLIKRPTDNSCYIYFSNTEELMIVAEVRIKPFLAAYHARQDFKHECEKAALKFHNRVASDLFGG